ncbi:MAG: helix-turn-helix domain-containing protein, partial [Bdellovibrionia bacterium]
MNLLKNELRKRIEKNPRYSLRAFANALGIHPSTLSAVLSNRRTLSPKSANRILTKLGLESQARISIVGKLISEDFQDSGPDEMPIQTSATVKVPRDLNRIYIHQALHALSFMKPESCEFTGVTLTVPSNRLDDARELTRDYFRALTELFEGG